MFGENRMRFFAASVWLICFASMWLIFNRVLPNEEFKTHLNQIEKSISAKDWTSAKKSMNQLNNIYESKRLVIQMNNATEIFTTFELTLGQLEASVQHEQDSAVEYVGAIRASLDFVMKGFSGP